MSQGNPPKFSGFSSGKTKNETYLTAESPHRSTRLRPNRTSAPFLPEAQGLWRTSMERIHVAVRSRPLSPEDARSSPWKISGNAIAHSAQSSSRFEFGTNSPASALSPRISFAFRPLGIAGSPDLLGLLGLLICCARLRYRRQDIRRGVPHYRGLPGPHQAHRR
jgi:hypothetical protein